MKKYQLTVGFPDSDKITFQAGSLTEVIEAMKNYIKANESVHFKVWEVKR